MMIDAYPLNHCNFDCDYAAMAAMISGMSDAQNALHRHATLYYDTLLPLAYTTFLVGVIYRYLPHRHFVWLCVLPMSVALFDFIENYHILQVLAVPILATATTAKILTALTSIKWVGFGLSCALAASFYIRVRYRRQQEYQRQRKLG